MKNYFSVSTSGESQLETAIGRYVFDLISLGAKIPLSNLGIAQLEDTIHDAFKEVVGDHIIDVSVEESTCNINISLV